MMPLPTPNPRPSSLCAEDEGAALGDRQPGGGPGSANPKPQKEGHIKLHISQPSLVS